MKKFIFTLMLAIAGCVWTMSVAETEPWIVATVHKVETLADCSTDGCPACYGVFMASVPDMEEDTSPYSPVPMAKFYQLTATDAQIAEQLNKLPLGKDVTIEGVPFTCGGSEYIQVAKIHERNEHLPSLCDEWNVLFVRMGANGDELSTEVHRLTTDTVINGKTYVQLYIYGDYGVRDRVTYRGALREDNNANVYIVPANSDHEYLLYAFNAKVGDKLTNLWVGGAAETGGLPDGLNARVTNITESSPRIFTLYLDIDEYHPIQWIEGVGLTDCPGGSICPGILGCACSCGHIMLCAYKDGKQVYASEEAEKYGCYYDSAKQPADTVALYWRSGDGPGSTTVTPVDPNQVVATLNDNLLTIREQSGEEVTYSLAVTPISHAPARHELPEAQKEVSADTFRNSVAVQLSEDGSYTLTLSKAGWENDIYGTFDYTASGLQPIAATDAPARKLLRNGQLLIRQGDHIYTPTGMQVE